MEKNPETAFLNKKSALLQLAEESPVPRTIVFCNKVCSSLAPSFKSFIVLIPFYFSLRLLVAFIVPVFLSVLDLALPLFPKL